MSTCTTGPYLRDRRWKARWGSPRPIRWWMWPITGRLGGPGGRFFFWATGFFGLVISGSTSLIRKRMKDEMRSRSNLKFACPYRSGPDYQGIVNASSGNDNIMSCDDLKGHIYKSSLFTHVDILRIHPLRHSPIKVVQKDSQRQLHICQPEIDSGAIPSPRPKRDIFEVVTREIYGAVIEPFWAEDFGVCPILGISSHRPGADEDFCLGRNRVATDLAFLSARSKESLSSMYFFPLRALRTSACAFAITSGFLMSSAIAQSTVRPGVSLPAANMS
ncbi:mRNA splicing factor [Striga asiatica]|uniref:mRNA splicing factor n=1 Tax=Striga asiatica TaxID=4170 RepID=A0A5A7PPK5_STRAF|nr:mRNA splicing factor [Striga asiatica]